MEQLSDMSPCWKIAASFHPSWVFQRWVCRLYEARGAALIGFLILQPEGAAVVFLERDSLAAKTLVISSSAPKTAALLQKRGYSIVTAEVSEFEVRRKPTSCRLMY
jgi:hypothetical protein